VHNDDEQPNPLDYVAEFVTRVMIAGTWIDVMPGTFRDVPSWNGGRSYRFDDAEDGHSIYVDGDALEAVRWAVVDNDDG